ncbi:MAG: hypothetical protein JW810_07460 [Sedimentisphaerales bacterium]|nr:hypothetical protein [Sedimentisphaerales bacterium]
MEAKGFRGDTLCISIFWVAFILIIPAHVAEGIILHPEAEPGEEWTDRPPDAVVGRWSTNASFVVIAPNWLITTRHQNTSPPTVQINGVDYRCHYDAAWTGGADGAADLRLVRLTTADGRDAQLTAYVPWYTGQDEAGKEIRLAGYGRGRGGVLTGGDPPQTYGYAWATGPDNHNQRLRWCTNRVAAAEEGQTGLYRGDLLVADFDDPDHYSATVYEGTLAEYDSGGGWFCFQDGRWFLIGLSRAVTAHGTPWPQYGQSWFRHPEVPYWHQPDLMDAVRISTHADWIEQITTTTAVCQGLTAGDLNENCRVDLPDLIWFAEQWLQGDCSEQNDWCWGADFEPHDEQVDLRDFSLLAQQWLECHWEPSWLCDW